LQAKPALHKFLIHSANGMCAGHAKDAIVRSRNQLSGNGQSKPDGAGHTETIGSRQTLNGRNAE